LRLLVFLLLLLLSFLLCIANQSAQCAQRHMCRCNCDRLYCLITFNVQYGR